jgi:hypothetical protein
MNAKKSLSKLPTAAADTRQNVRVICRVRPSNKIEQAAGGTNCVKHTTESIEVLVEDRTDSFTFDRVFGADSTQEEVFTYTAKGLISDVMAGYNATIFAYGQTGTGKVFVECFSHALPILIQIEIAELIMFLIFIVSRIRRRIRWKEILATLAKKE